MLIDFQKLNARRSIQLNVSKNIMSVKRITSDFRYLSLLADKDYDVQEQEERYMEAYVKNYLRLVTKQWKSTLTNASLQRREPQHGCGSGQEVLLHGHQPHL